MMMRLMRASLLVLLLLSSVACSDHTSDLVPSWLLGSWELSYNPEGDDQDSLTFDDSGRVTVHTQDRRNISGRYHVQDSTVLLLLTMGAKQLETQFELDSYNKRLVYSNGAYYTKR